MKRQYEQVGQGTKECVKNNCVQGYTKIYSPFICIAESIMDMNIADLANIWNQFVQSNLSKAFVIIYVLKYTSPFITHQRSIRET